jgi:hypothetical protein
VDLLSKFLDYMRKLRLAMAEPVGGALHGCGRFPNKLAEENRLLAESFAPSSFSISLSYAHPQLPATLLDIEWADYELFTSLLFEDIESEALNGICMSARFRSHYRYFLSLAVEYDVTAGTRTKKRSYRANLSPQNAVDRAQLINYSLLA